MSMSVTAIAPAVQWVMPVPESPLMMNTFGSSEGFRPKYATPSAGSMTCPDHR